MKTILGFAAVAGIFLAVGTMDKHDAELERAYYCSMVELDIWPDYRGIGAECGTNPARLSEY